MLALNDAHPADALRAEPLIPLGQSLQERALQAYQATQRTGRAPATLREAGLLALTLRERRRLTGTWSGLLQEILPRQVQAGILGPVWRTPLACLYGIVPDPEEMLRALLVKNATATSFDWVTLAQLSQPVSEEEHIHVFSHLLHGLPVAVQLSLLRVLSLRGRESMAAALADGLLIGHPAFANVRAQLNPTELDLPGLSSRALALQQMGAFYHLSGRQPGAFPVRRRRNNP